MDQRYTGLARELEDMTAAIKNALEGIGLTRFTVSIDLVSEIGSEHSRRSMSPIVVITANFWENMWDTENDTRPN